MRARTLMTLAVMAGLVACTLVACTKEAPGLGGGGAGGTVGNNANALISGRVFDSETNQPVMGATVKTPSGTTVTTNANGEFQIEADPGKTVLTVEEADHAKGVKEVEAYQDAESYVELFAKGVSKDTSTNGVTGGTAKVGEMTVVVPKDAVETEDGTKYNGQVTIEVATVRPEKANELSAFPGKFDGTTVDDQARSVATQAAAAIRLLSAAGQPLRMRGTARVEIFMPVRLALSQHNTRLWKLREASADWEEVGFGAIRQEDPLTHEPALRTAVSALTWWNAGNPFFKSRVQGCLQLPRAGGEPVTGAGGASAGTAGAASVPIGGSGARDDEAAGGVAGVSGLDAGTPRTPAPLIGDNPLAGIHVVATGIGYGYFAETHTDDQGCFALEVKALAPVAIFAQSRFKRSQPTRVLALGRDMVRDLGMITLGERDSECPGAMVECEGGCVDVLTDDFHCGECGNVCRSTPSGEYPTVVPEHCSYGVCGCDEAPVQEACGGGCANIETDRENCGGCGSIFACGMDQECIDSTCVDIMCSAGEVVCNGLCVPADPGCGVAMDCQDWNGVGCTPIDAVSSEAGFENCCAAGSCGISFSDLLATPCASTEYGRPNSTACPSEDVFVTDAFSGYGTGCCRSDGQCGLVVEGHQDLGCILRADISRNLAAVSCGGGGTAPLGCGGAEVCTYLASVGQSVCTLSGDPFPPVCDNPGAACGQSGGTCTDFGGAYYCIQVCAGSDGGGADAGARNDAGAMVIPDAGVPLMDAGQ